MLPTAFERIRDKLRDNGCEITTTAKPNVVKSQCPAHTSQTTRSRPLTVTGTDQKALIWCHAGCQQEDVMAALDMTMRDLFDNHSGATYQYPDTRTVHRTADKKFWQSGNTKGTALYRSDELGSATPVFVTEGEKDTDAIRAVGGSAVSAAGGAGNGHKADWLAIEGMDVIIVADKDDSGKKHALQVAALVLAAGASSVRIVEALEGKDAADHVAAGHSLDTFAEVPWWPLDEQTDPAQPNTDYGGNTPTNAIEDAINERLGKLRIEREARRRLEDETRQALTPPPINTLDSLLAEPDEVTPYLIDRIAPAGGRVLLSAQYKAGKTTLVGNAVRSLVDRDPFLDRFAVNDQKQNLVIVDDELSRNTIRRWLREQAIENTAAVADVVALRGKVGAFNLCDDKLRTQWATRLRDIGCDYLVLDCLRPILDALGLDENRDAGQFLVAFDALLDEAGIPDALLVQHMGHANERARGDSRLQDWPDAIWRLVREDDTPESARYFSAYGRDVDVPEGRLGFDPATRRLSYAAGSRKDTKTEAALLAVIEVLAADAKGNGEGLSNRAIEDALADSGHARAHIRSAVKQAIGRQFVAVQPGARSSLLHSIVNPCSECGRPMVIGQTNRHKSCASWEGDRG